LLWIALPLRTQQRAKPWVEGTVKKTATSVTAATIALVIPLAELLRVPMAAAVSCLAAAVALVCCGICFRMHRLYYDAMWSLAPYPYPYPYPIPLPLPPTPHPHPYPYP